MRPLLLLALSSALLLSGCIGTSSNVRSAYAPAQGDRFTYTLDNYGGMTPEARAIFEPRLQQKLGSLLVAGEDASAKRINIRVTYYRMRNGAARFMVGIMAGRDRIQSEVSIVAPDGKVLGTMSVDSSNSTAMGTSRGLIEGHADEIAAFVKAGGKSAQVPATPTAAPSNDQACKACAKIGSQ
ncbi:DUF4410 domain-containing protein [Lysobacter fragariae]